MFSPIPIRHPLPSDDDALDTALAALPPKPAIFLVDVGNSQKPYLSRTANLRLRLRRLMRPPALDSKMLNLRNLAREVRYWPVDSMLMSSLILLEQAKPLYPGRYRRMLGLRPLYFVSLLTSNPFPRAVVTRSPKDNNTAFGPFAHRKEAETFLERALTLFQLRRCDEVLRPSPSHPGCIYGEMSMCLRPCQDLSAGPAYQAESGRFLEFLSTIGNSLREDIERDRDAASEALDFEAAARHHKRLSKLDACFSNGSRIATHYARLHGVAVTPTSDQRVRLWPVWEGKLHSPLTVPPATLDGPAIRQLLQASRNPTMPSQDETSLESLTVLVRWVHSSWCDGEWVAISDPSKPPARKLVNACLRVAGIQLGETSGNRLSEGGEEGNESKNLRDPHG